MNKTEKLFVAGHRGLVGSAICKNLDKEQNLVVRTRQELDLLDPAAVSKFFETQKPTYLIDAAARVGGILANKTKKAQFIYENLSIQNHLIHNAFVYGVKKLLFLGSSCIYPKLCPQPMKEEYLLSGPLEETNDAYAIAKIAGILMCKSYREQYGCNFISCMPTNLYGPNDNFDLEHSHVLPAMIRKFHIAKTTGQKLVTLWGSGEVYREFLHVNDMASACLFLMENYNEKEIINIGTGTDVTIRELADIIREIVGFSGEIIWDRSKPDGTQRKLLDCTKIHALGWKANINLTEGIESTYRWFCEHQFRES